MERVGETRSRAAVERAAAQLENAVGEPAAALVLCAEYPDQVDQSSGVSARSNAVNSGSNVSSLRAPIMISPFASLR